MYLAHRPFLTVVWCVALASCATPAPISEGTLLISEVTRILSREEIKSGYVGPSREEIKSGYYGPEHKEPGLYQRLLSQGHSDSDLTEGRVVAYRSYYRASARFRRDKIEVEIVARGLVVEVGNIVEVTVKKDQRGVERGIVTSVRFKTKEDGGCEYQRLSGGIREVLAGLTFSDTYWYHTLWCPHLEQEGWVRPMTLWQKRPTKANPSQ